MNAAMTDKFQMIYHSGLFIRKMNASESYCYTIAIHSHLILHELLDLNPIPDHPLQSH